MQKRKMLLNTLLLGIAFIASSNGITAEAATGKYSSLLEISANLISTGRTMDNIVNNSSEWRYGRATVGGKNYKTLTLAQKYCFNRVTGQAAIPQNSDNVGNIVFDGSNGLADNTKYTIDTSKVGNGYHEYRRSFSNGTQVPVGYWKNYGLVFATHGETFNADDSVLYEGGYYDTKEWGTWANYHGVDFHAYSKINKYPLKPNERITKCFDKQNNNYYRNSTAWKGYCAVCGELINPGFHYAPASAMKELSVVEIGVEDMFTCPTCGGMENTSKYNHKCKAISANRYYVVYDDGTDDPNVTGNTNTSTFYYDFADEYEGETVKSQDRYLAECGFIRDGYTFIGWSTTKDGTVDYQPSTTSLRKFQDPAVNNKVTTLYAVWKPNHSYLEVDANANIYNGGARYDKQTKYFREDTYQILNNNNPADPAAPSFKKSTYTIDASKITLPTGYIVSFVSEGSTPNPITAQTHFTGYNFKKSGANGSFVASTTTYTYGSDDRTKENPDIVTLQFTQDTIVLPGTNANNKSFIGWYDGPDDNSHYIGTTGDEYYPSRNTTLYAKFSQMKIDVKSTYFRTHSFVNDADEFKNIALNVLGNANNSAFGANHAYSVQHGTGAVNMQIGTFTNTTDEYVYKTFYRIKGTTEWTEINSADGSSGAPSADKINSFVNYGDYDDPNHPENGKTIIIKNSGFYQLTAIGAQGGDMPNAGKSGGKGGKTEAIYYLKKGDILHIWVGGQGYSDGNGGYNGGGAGTKDIGAGGGGATTVVLERSGQPQKTLMIAGGGGGATTLEDGGAGGGN